MQHTDKYQLNLIETSDTFSPEALNENAQKLEQAISAEAAAQDQARAADIAALDQRLQVFEAHRLVIGGAKEGEKVYLDFTPKVLYVAGFNGAHQLFFDGRVSASGLRFVNGELKHDGYYASLAYIAFL